MTKINKRWAIVIVTLFTGILIACTIFTTKEVKKANAEINKMTEYVTAFYTYPVVYETTIAGSQTKIYPLSFTCQYTLRLVQGVIYVDITSGTQTKTVTDNMQEVFRLENHNGITDSVATPTLNVTANIINMENIKSLDALQNSITNFTFDDTSYYGRVSTIFNFGPTSWIVIQYKGYLQYEHTMQGSMELYRIEAKTSQGGLQSSYNNGYIAGQESMKGAINIAREEGYKSGYTAGAQQASSLGNILLGIGGVPFETLQSILDFDLLGINISSLVMSILTAAIAIWIVKLFI